MQRYRVHFAFRFRFTPRDVDDMTCQEFDEFAAACDEMTREEDKQRREAERSSASAGRRRR